MAFQKATKKHARLRLALIGTSGSGKTFSALRIARGLVGPSGRIAVADTERGSASKYADRFTFDAQDMETFAPNDFVQVIQEAERGGYDCLIIDSLSHAWMGKGGALEMVDNAAKRSKSGNSFNAWREVTPEHNAMVDAIVRARCHVIVTMRAKTEYVIETNDKGRQIPRKVGLAPVQRDGLEYEFDVVGDMDSAGLIVTKTRCPSLDGQVIARPGEELGAALRAWLTDGVASSGEIRTATQSPREAKAAEVATFERPVDKPALTKEQVTKVESVAAQLGGQVTRGGAAAAGVVAFGPHKGLSIADLTDQQLSELVDLANVKLLEEPKAQWAKKMEANRELLFAEISRRGHVANEQTQRQPGED